MEENRSFGVDVLKILAMLFICAHHILVHGGALDAAEQAGAGAFAWLLFGVTSVGVNVFAMTSGYLGAYRRVRLSSAVMHWLQVVFYTVVITAAAVIFWPGTVGKQEILNALCPVTFQQYWYVTAYFAMFAFSPILNQAIAGLTKRMLAGYLLAILILLSVQQTVLQFDIYGTDNGYSALWLMAMYLTGGLLRRFEVNMPVRARGIGAVVALAGFAGMWVFKLFVEASALELSFNPTLLMRYNSPLMVMAAVGMMTACIRLDTGNERVAHVCAALAQASFGVYLIHDHLFIRENVMSGSFAFITSAGKLCLVPVCAAGVYLCCTGIDMVRAKLFEIFRVKKIVHFMLNGAGSLANRLLIRK